MFRAAGAVLRSRRVRPARHILSPIIPRHRHVGPYAALVLAGAYEEAGEGGRWRVSGGDVLIHAAFSSHLDRTLGPRTVVLDLPLPPLWARRSTRWRTEAVDEVARLAERDLEAAGALLCAHLQASGPGLSDLPDQLAASLSTADGPGIDEWAAAHGVARTTAWRWFDAVYGVAPARFRREARVRRAWWQIVDGDASLATIAAGAGFADQAHMTREVRALTGRTPGAWRRRGFALQHSCKTAAE